VLPGMHYQGKVKVNVVGRWKEALNEPLWVVNNIEPKEALKVYEKRMKIEELFRASVGHHVPTLVPT
jgi:hypothetical protein